MCIKLKESVFFVLFLFSSEKLNWTLMWKRQHCYIYAAAFCPIITDTTYQASSQLYQCFHTPPHHDHQAYCKPDYWSWHVCFLFCFVLFVFVIVSKTVSKIKIEYQALWHLEISTIDKITRACLFSCGQQSRLAHYQIPVQSSMGQVKYQCPSHQQYSNRIPNSLEIAITIDSRILIWS